MPAVPGTFAGQKYPDLRILILPDIRHYYQQRGEWGLIVGFRSYEHSEVVTLHRKYATVRHTWRLQGERPWRRWVLTKETYVNDRN